MCLTTNFYTLLQTLLYYFKIIDSYLSFLMKTHKQLLHLSSLLFHECNGDMKGFMKFPKKKKFTQ
jgi:hypothetical protein